MIRSMTAFARRDVQAPWGTAWWELRSVNHRYLEVATRLPEELRALEPEVRSRVGARLGRGKVDCTLRYQPTFAAGGTVSINRALAEQIARASREIDQLLYSPAPVHSLDVLRWPGVLEVEAPDQETVSSAVLTLLDGSLDDLVEGRRREGERIAEFLRDRLDEVGPLVASVRSRAPDVVAAARERLLTRLAELKAEVDPQRLEQEVVLLAQRLDVSEELDRLAMHVQEVARALASDAPVGRRLDFLMQELNREANTLGSKSADSQVARAAVDLKVLIEQMREQIQNVE